MQAPAGTTVADARNPFDIVADYLALMKPRIVVLVLVTAFAAMWVAGNGSLSWAVALCTLVGVALSAGAANAINCYIDRDIDAVMHRTRRRPLPAGRLQPRRALVFGVVTGTVAFIFLAVTVNLLSAALCTLALLFYVFVYTAWLKRSTPQNIVIGGAAGAAPPLVGWAAVTGEVGWAAYAMFAIVFVWTPPHFWALALFRRDDYRAAGVPMLPVVRGEAGTRRRILLYAVGTVVVSLTLYWPLAALGALYLGAAAALGAGFLWLAVATRRDTGHRAARQLFAYSIL